MTTPRPRRRTRATLTTADAPARTPLAYFIAGTPTSVNRHYARAATGRVYLSQAAREWEGTVRDETLFVRDAVREIGAPLALTLTFIGGRADVDNLLKAVLDGFKHATGIDDHWITRLTVIRELRGKRQAGVWIEVHSAHEYQKAC